jgi:hypothetical protein
VIAGRIVQALSKVKLTAQEMNTAIKKQGQMLKATNKRADKNKLELTKQNNQLKEMITKHKGGK